MSVLHRRDEYVRGMSPVLSKSLEHDDENVQIRFLAEHRRSSCVLVACRLQQASHFRGRGILRACSLLPRKWGVPQLASGSKTLGQRS